MLPHLADSALGKISLVGHADSIIYFIQPVNAAYHQKLINLVKGGPGKPAVLLHLPLQISIARP